MPKEDEIELLELRVKVPAHLKFGFKRLSTIYNGGETQFMTKLIEEGIRERHGEIGLEEAILWYKWNKDENYRYPPSEHTELEQPNKENDDSYDLG